jgi:hypothetical protein
MSCHALESAMSGESPFSRDFLFDYYDGSVSGLVECGPGRAVFTFRMVAWDDRQEQRVYVLQPVSADSFDEAARAHQEEDAFERYQEILRGAGPVEYVVQAEDDIDGPLRSIHRVGEGAVRERIDSMLVAVGLEEDFAASEHTYDEWVALLRTIP